MSKIKLLIAGGRDFTDSAFMVNNLNKLEEAGNFVLEPSKTEIISGMARGADTIAYKLAKANGFTVLEFPADWNTFGRRAGFVRNITMLENADHVVAFWDAKSRGTEHTIIEARKRGIPVDIVYYNAPDITLFS